MARGKDGVTGGNLATDTKERERSGGTKRW